jgi:competence protein ComEC
MSRLRHFLLGGALLLSMAGASASAVAAERPLRIVSVDVEGGAATLFVTPEGRSLLIDTGWPEGLGGPRGAPGAPPPPSSADRIAEAAAALGVHRIDYLIVTHYHVDHVGGLGALLGKLPVGVVIDHGPNREAPPPGASAQSLQWSPSRTYPQYLELTKGLRRISARAGDRFEIGSMSLTVVSSDAQPIAHPLEGGGGQGAAACAEVKPMAADGGEENARSVASVISFGRARIAAFGDLSWNMEARLACPVDLVGPVDVLIVTQHGSQLSSNPASLGELKPIVAVMDNGPTKGGDPTPIQTISQSPRLKGFWRLHASARHPETDGPPDYIANLVGGSDGHAIEVDVSRDGTLKVVNTRNAFSQAYSPAP